MNTKKKVERQYLDVMCRGLADFPAGIIENSEEPDFLVISPGRRVGIEVTGIYDTIGSISPSLKSQDSECASVVAAAQSRANNCGLPPLLLEVFFDARVPIAKKDREHIIDKLVTTVSSNVPAIEGECYLENRNPFTQVLPPHIAAVSLRRIESVRSHHWQVGNAGIVNENFVRLLQETIDGKNDKLANYRTRCSECWLAVVADWLGPSAYFEMSDQMSNESYSTDFDRVYFVEGHSGRVVALSTRPQKSAVDIDLHSQRSSGGRINPSR